MKNQQLKFQRLWVASSLTVVLLLTVSVIGSMRWGQGHSNIRSKEQQATLLSGNLQTQTETRDVAQRRIKISVKNGRPVAEAIKIIEQRFGWAITYEDPRYLNASEISDVTEKVRRDLDKFPPGQAPRVLVPKGGNLTFEYDAGTESSPPDPNLIVQQLLAAHVTSGNAGRFVMESAEDVIHVVPTAVKDASGKLTLQKSILDQVITLPTKERTGQQTLEDVCAAVSKATKQHVVVGTIPLRLFVSHKDRQETKNLKARDALIRLFQRTASDANLTWQLFYDPGVKMYALNIQRIERSASR